MLKNHLRIVVLFFTIFRINNKITGNTKTNKIWGVAFMKKLVLVLLIISTVFIISANPLDEDKEFIRLHVLANSDNPEDQALKYAVKDAIVEEFSPVFHRYNNILETRFFLENNLEQFEKVAQKKIESLHSNYTVRVQYGNFYFPTKYYGDFSLPAGQYEAVRVIIGEGKGANWWCVLFPPMCFVPQEKSANVGQSYALNHNEVQVKLKLWEWLKDLWNYLRVS